MLGKIQARNESLLHIPLLPQIAQDLSLHYTAKGVHATAAMEGNSLSEEEVLHYIRKDKGDVPKSKMFLQHAIQNIIDICEHVGTHPARGGYFKVTPAVVKDMNAAILKGTHFAEHVTPGEFRVGQVRLGSYAAPPVADCPHLVEKLCHWINGETFRPPERQKSFDIVHAFLRAVTAHVYLAWIHPFGDGNGRTARLLEFQILVSAGVPAPSAHLLSAHYFTTRQEYFLQLDSAARTMSLAPFLEYAAQGFLDGLDDQLRYVNERNRAVAWRNHIYETLREEKEKVRRRLTQLALGIATLSQPVPAAKVLKTLPHLLAEYAGVTTRTLYRDLNELKRRELVLQTGNGFLAGNRQGH